jgi:hypothetical protein
MADVSKGKAFGEEPKQHRIRITLSSRNVEALEKGACVRTRVSLAFGWLRLVACPAVFPLPHNAGDDHNTQWNYRLTRWPRALALAAAVQC